VSKIVMMSAQMSRDEIDEALASSPSAFMPKPFDLDHMWDLIRKPQARICPFSTDDNW
jgi:DNA-binding NarL/FixJ family response regulator